MAVESVAPATEIETIDELVKVTSPERREAFLLTQIVGLTYEKTASIIGCPVGTIRSRVARAREELLEAHLRNEAV